MFPAFAYARPGTAAEAVQLMSRDNAALHSGGTDLLSCLREHIFPVETVVSLADVPDLTGIAKSGKGLTVGGMTTITDIEKSEMLTGAYRALAQAAGEVASPQIRHQGTIGGNVCQKSRCWYYRGEFDCIRKGGSKCYAFKGENQLHCIFGGANCYMVHPSDPLPALAALDAKIIALGPYGERAIPAESFAMDPSDDPTKATVLDFDEVVLRIELPAWPGGAYGSYRKVRARRSWDFSVTGMALTLVKEGNKVKRARVVFSGVAPIPWRSKAVEEVLQGASLNADTISKAVQVSSEGAKALEHNAYKIPLLHGVVREELTKAAEA